eukprot:TRINITY_DN1273_c0_g1_i1.p2 TRINITY_DN1273_c0_g1~~TRINITY_DN1273_c0_g1_i1.p2  ORF type:complete len:327 (-),score=71.23 TRINITY_DN1273_c0_g1_i1:83-1063(-)
MNCRFDIDFFESQCSEASKTLVEEYLRRGVFTHSDGAVGCFLEDKKLGFCMLLKSNGTGLYATKDLVLARMKFDKFSVDKSVYVVASEQEYHFKQVFATLKQMGYGQASKCVHAAYGMVVLPSGKMSSRKGNVILFSQLDRELRETITSKFLNDIEGKLDPPPDAAEKERICHAVAVAAIRYGMLNHATRNDVVFEIEKWTDPKGDTGPYLLYQQTRCTSILRKVAFPKEGKADFKILDQERLRVMIFHLINFQSVVERSAHGNKPGDDPSPSALCTYLYELAQMFSSWQGNMPVKIKDVTDPNERAALLMVVSAVGATLNVASNC